jgi:hypothetical protein
VLQEPTLAIGAGVLGVGGALAGAYVTVREQRAAGEEEREAAAKERVRAPALSLELDASENGRPAFKIVKDSECAYFRLRVRNAAGRGRATDVHVEIEAVEFRDGKELHAVTGLRSMWLAWADRQLTNPRAERERETVSTGSAVLLDLVHLNASVKGKMILDVRPQPIGRPNQIPATRLTLTLAIHSAECEPTKFAVDVDYDGHRWAGWDDPTEPHLQVHNLLPA